MLSSKTDPIELATYHCTRKLNNFLFRVGPLYHQYVGTGNAIDGYSCSGLETSGANPFDTPGKIEPDEYMPERCAKVDDNQCIEQCIAKGRSQCRRVARVGLMPTISSMRPGGEDRLRRS